MRLFTKAFGPKWLFILLAFVIMPWTAITEKAQASENREVDSDAPNSVLNLSEKITNWVPSENGEYIYALLSSSNRLIYINTSTMKIDKERTVSSNPSDMVLGDDGKLYIASIGSTSISVVDTVYGTSLEGAVSNIEIGRLSSKIAVTPNSIFFTTNELNTLGQWDKLGVFDLKTRQVTILGEYFHTNSYSYYSPDLEINTDKGLVYIGQYSNPGISSVSTSTYEVVSRYNESSSYSYGSRVVLDGDNLYVSGKRFNANNLSQIMGSYNAAIVYAKDELVFSTKAVYDRDTYQKIMDLPVPISQAYIKADGSIYIYEYNPQADFDNLPLYRVRKFNTFNELYMYKDALKPGKASFMDVDSRTDNVAGSIFFAPALDESLLTHYSVVALADDGSYRFDLGTVNKSAAKINGKYYVNVTNKSLTDSILNGTSARLKIAVYSRTNFTGSVVFSQQPSLSPLWDYPNYQVSNIQLNDQEAETSKLKGSLTWGAAGKQYPGDRYEVYYTDRYLPIGSPIYSIDATKSSYTFDIPSAIGIPANASSLAIVMKSASGDYAPEAVYIGIPKKISRAPLASEIDVKNYAAGKNDSVTISNLLEKDVVNVYDYNGNLLGQGQVKDGETKTTISITQLDPEVRLIYVTVTSVGKVESLETGKLYGADGSAATGGGAGGGGGGGGAGGGGGGFGGGGMPTEDYKSNTVNTNGIVRVHGNFDQGQLKKIAEKQLSTANHKIIVEMKSTGASGYQIQFQAQELKDILSLKDNAEISLKTTDGTVQFPVHVLQEAFKSSGNNGNIDLKISIDQLSKEDKTKVSQALAKVGGTLVENGLDFKLSLVKGDQIVRTIDKLPVYIGHTLVLPKSFKLKDNETISGASWDPITNKLIPVPMTLVLGSANEPASAILWKNENSAFVLYTSKKTFIDVKADYFASKSIESLAASLVLEGFEDETFRADANVTRAEFAAMLIRGLALSLPEDTIKSFTDVNSADWYKDAVNTAVHAGLISGYEDDTFHPNQPITHQEAIKMLGNALSLISSLHQVPISEQQAQLDSLNGTVIVDDWAIEAAAMLIKQNILVRNDGFEFEKDRATTRGETALLLDRLLKKAMWPK